MAEGTFVDEFGEPVPETAPAYWADRGPFASDGVNDCGTFQAGYQQLKVFNCELMFAYICEIGERRSS